MLDLELKGVENLRRFCWGGEFEFNMGFDNEDGVSILKGKVIMIFRWSGGREIWSGG